MTPQELSCEAAADTGNRPCGRPLYALCRQRVALMDADPKAMQAAVQKALADVTAEVERGILTRWVVIAETMDGDGSTGTWALAAEGMKSWEALGMLEYARQCEQSKSANNHRTDDE